MFLIPFTNQCHSARQRLTTTVLASLIAFSGQAAALNTCQGMLGTWSDGTGSWLFSSQGSNGSLVGTLKNSPGGQCSGGQDYNVGGNLINGVLVLTATWHDDGGPDNNPRPTGCAQTISYSGSVTGPGCRTGTGTWSNSGGSHGTFNLAGQCMVPTGETGDSFVGWLPETQYTARAKFSIQMAPTNFNFGGRTAQETFPTSEDNCHYVGSPVGMQVPVINTISIASALPGVYQDYLAASDIYLNWYRQVGKLPCGITAAQHIQIDCNSTSPPDYTYESHSISMLLDKRTVNNTRAGVSSGNLVWGIPAPSLTLWDQITDYVLGHH